MDQDIQKHIISEFGHKLRVRVSGICVKNESILLIKHVNIGAKPILWSPPGGGMEFGESAKEALVREFKEETNTEILVGKLMFVNEFNTYPLHAVELFFEVEILSGDLKKGLDPELSLEMQIIKDLRFVSFFEIQKNTELYHSFLKNIKNKADLEQLNGYLE